MKKFTCSAIFTVLLIAGTVFGDSQELSSSKAELMGRVEDLFMKYSARDLTYRKSLEWGDVEKHADGSRSILYRYEFRVRDKEPMVMEQIITFSKDGLIQDKVVEGFPKTIEQNLATKKGMIEHVEDFFGRNFKDISSRETVEWGNVEKDADGNFSIRYRCVVTILNKEKLTLNQVFVFSPAGQYVRHEDVEGFPKKVKI